MLILTRELFETRGMIKALALTTLISLFTVTLSIHRAEAVITTADLVDATDSYGPGYNTPVVWTSFIDPSITNWIGFHNTIAPTDISGNQYIGGGSAWIGLVDDYLNLTVTNSSGSLFRTMDYNNAMGNESGIQSVIFGAANTAPDVYRLQNPWTNPQWVTFNEAGAFNSFITTADTYTFTMTYGNTGGATWQQSHADMYFLVDTEPLNEPVPEPATVALLGIGLAGLAGTELRRRQKKKVVVKS